MTETTVSLAEASVVVVCLDGIQEHDWIGRLYVRSKEEPYFFHGMLELLEYMEQFYDSIDYPQASMNSRSFGGKVEREEKKTQRFRTSRKNEQPVVLSKQEIQEKRGRRATFLVRVQYRQQATWQGQITWEERERTVAFRSALELLKLMDRAEGSLEESLGGGVKPLRGALWNER